MMLNLALKNLLFVVFIIFIWNKLAEAEKEISKSWGDQVEWNPSNERKFVYLIERMVHNKLSRYLQLEQSSQIPL